MCPVRCCRLYSQAVEVQLPLEFLLIRGLQQSSPAPESPQTYLWVPVT